jgi:hypothetical protein
MSSAQGGQNETTNLPAEVPVAALEGLSIAEMTVTITTTTTTTTITTALAATATAPDKEDDEEAFQDFLLETAPAIVICPISHALFREPVIAQDTHTYELEKLQEWIETCTRQGNPLTSPVTGAVMFAGVHKVARNAQYGDGAHREEDPGMEGDRRRQEERLRVCEWKKKIKLRRKMTGRRQKQ